MAGQAAAINGLSSYPYPELSTSFFLFFFSFSLSAKQTNILFTQLNLLNTQVAKYHQLDGGLLMGLSILCLYTQKCSMCPFLQCLHNVCTHLLFIFLTVQSFASFGVIRSDVLSLHCIPFCIYEKSIKLFVK